MKRTNEQPKSTSRSLLHDIAFPYDATTFHIDIDSAGLVQKKILEYELESMGIRLNKVPPDITFKNKKNEGATCFVISVYLQKQERENWTRGHRQDNHTF